MKAKDLRALRQFIIVLFTILFTISCKTFAEKTEALYSFSTTGSPVYHLQPGTVDKSGKRVIISAAYDGMISCYLPSGELIWKTPTGGFFPNDLQVTDINGDGLDETLVASARYSTMGTDTH